MPPAPHRSRLARFVAQRAGRWLSLVRLLPYARPGLLTAAVALNTAIGVLPLVFVVAMGVLLNRLPAGARPDGGGWDGIAAALAAAVTAFAVQQVTTPYQAALGEAVARRVDGACLRRLMSVSLSRVPLGELERKETLDRLADARNAFDQQTPTPGQAAAGLLALVARYTLLAGATLLVVITLGPLQGLLIGATALLVRFGQRGSLIRFAGMWSGLTGARRRITYIRRIAGGPAMAKEIRILGLTDWFRERLRGETRAYLTQVWRNRRRLLIRPFAALAAVGLAGGALTLALLAAAASAGELSLLQLSVALQGVLVLMRFGVYFPECDFQTQYGLLAHDTLRRLERLSPPEPPPADPAVPGPALRDGVRFERVSFRYAPGSPTVLDGLDLDIAAGRSTAIVGLNGAGKSTLVKLLTRLHEPTGGRITVDGEDLREVGEERWQRRLAVVFQDFVRFELSLADNIRMGAPDVPDSAHARRALSAAVDRAGVRGLVERLPHGPETVLSSRYAGGSDLSGGQWQRVALARVSYAVEHGARLLVLDEPTAQLDARAEVEFFDRFLTTTKGLTSVVISHRFSSVRRADHIVVIEHGRVVEQGTHEELVALGGRYAGLFLLQAERFREPADGGRAGTEAFGPAGDPEPAGAADAGTGAVR
ncbi:ABC transporter ATP-binding protein [Streptomyces sp. NPDC014894]|uniref:ABC transporter ATP-binding protein n=1 Tax=Streptomyces sp. NPDC014894 TaxID=3364931 RepID=UPI0037010583